MLQLIKIPDKFFCKTSSYKKWDSKIVSSNQKWNKESWYHPLFSIYVEKFSQPNKMGMGSFSWGSCLVEGNMAFSSHHGICLSIDICVLQKGESCGKNVTVPAVFKVPTWPDIVNFVHTNPLKNNRDPFHVSELTSYHQYWSWGTGRATVQLSRVPGGGTYSSGQGTFAKMCCGATCLH